jgi:eukaryotic-like serine/threonine-protein kinase
MDVDAKDGNTTPAAPITPGDVVADKYRIDAVVGRGGMSVVYRATHLHLDQLVAIKVLSTTALLMPEYVARLKREARAASRIRSEHVVRIFDIGELAGSGIPYLVMEHLVGADLSQVLAKRGPLPVHLAVECIMQACEALAEAHAVGIIHRDLKPANLFLTEGVDGSPCVKVLDFGISRMTRRQALSPLTDPGTVLGTPSYMAPEQMEAADNIDTRSDIWAIGAILYELLVGRPPFAGQSLPQLFVKIMRSKTPRPSAVRDDVDPGVDEIVARCLAVDPARRFATVADLAWALAALNLDGPSAHRRDSAARIARVFDRRSAESGVDRVLSAPPILVRAEPTDELEGISTFRHRIAAAASAALLFGAAVGFVAVARDSSVGETTTTTGATTAAMLVPVPAPVPAPPRVPAPMPGSPEANVASLLPVLDPPADAGRPPPPVRTAPLAHPAPLPRPKPMVEDTGDAGPLAAMPASTRIDDGTSMAEEPAGSESD